MSIIKMSLIIIAISCLFGLYNLVGLYNGLSELKAIESEQRDSINAIACHELNDNIEDYYACMYNY